ncbi:28S ribosomal protein S7, mitochondrial [Zootermopsis nevadensis]|uniref:28S ribosomal protein S7, mitochondrial n=1 Tax=Zootermopsis nevadensis TaxID=136037 RepID=A0A067QQP8_ZOONE|nr:28S ribosomal protein S7, mitochondrial [Zootermopsis nevadensis]KDR12187.1 28S ribosomal protein S7, mitochondrial [Zootermopsis nevadensis]
MAPLNMVFGSVLRKNIIFNNAEVLYKRVNLVNAYSMYGPQFVEPVYKKDKQESMYESGEIENILHVPVKAARVDATCSVFHDELVRKFTNLVMRDGRKILARELIEEAFEKIKRIQLQRYHSTEDPEKKTSVLTDPLKIFHAALANSKPVLQLTPIKRGGVTYQVPVPITDKRSQFLAMKWIILAAKDKDPKVHFPEKLAWELVDAAGNQGKVVKKKQDLHRQCEANRAYAHYRWS